MLPEVTLNSKFTRTNKAEVLEMSEKKVLALIVRRLRLKVTSITIDVV